MTLLQECDVTRPLTLSPCLCLSVYKILRFPLFTPFCSKRQCAWAIFSCYCHITNVRKFINYVLLGRPRSLKCAGANWNVNSTTVHTIWLASVVNVVVSCQNYALVPFKSLKIIDVESLWWLFHLWLRRPLPIMLFAMSDILLLSSEAYTCFNFS